MEKKKTILLLIFILLFLTTSKTLLFYDSPEYLNIVSNNSFLKSLSLGHPPIHPVFIGSLWIVFRLVMLIFRITPEYGANIAAFIFGIISVFLFLRLSRFFLSGVQSLLATIIFALFPVVWIINSNLMVESLLLPLFLLSIIFFVKYLTKPARRTAVFYLFSIILLLGAHIQMLFWLPTLFGFPLLFLDMNRNIKLARLARLYFLTIIAIGFSIILYFTIFWFSGGSVWSRMNELFLGRITEHFYFPDISKAVFLIVRNVWLEIIRGFGTLTSLIFIYILFRKRKEKIFLLGMLFFACSLLISGSVWTGDFMVRRIVFAGAIFALVFAKNLSKKAMVILLIYLLPISLANMRLYFFNRSNIPFIQMKRVESTVPKGNILIQTHYVRPFTYPYNGEMFWVGHDNFDRLDEAREKGSRIFLDSQAVFAPYLLYVGNNLHITSLGKFGVSEAKPIFEKNTVDLFTVYDPDKRIFILSLKKEGTSFEERVILNKKLADDNTSIVIGIAKPSSSVLVYSTDFFQRIHNERIDYGDLFTWIWIILTNKHDPLTWTYADKDGVFVIPINQNKKGRIYIEGENIQKKLLIARGVITEL